MCIAALFINNPNWKQPRCSSVGKQMKCSMSMWWNACVCAKSLQSCPTLCDSVDCSLSGSSVHGILQARILQWVAMPSSRGSSRPRDWTCVFYISCIEAGSLSLALPGKPRTVEYYSAVKINELLIHATIYISIKRTLLSERSQTQVATFCVILFTWHSGRGKMIENRSVVAGRILREQGVVDCKGITHGNFQCDGTVLGDYHDGEHMTLCHFSMSRSIELYKERT